MLGGLKEDTVQYSQLESALKHMRQREQVCIPRVFNMPVSSVDHVVDTVWR